MMRSRSRFVLFLFAAIVLMANGIPALAQAAKPIKLRYALLWPATHPIVKLVQQWGDEIEKATEGRVTFSYFPGNTLCPPPQVFDNVVKGIVDIGSTLLAYAPGRLPLSEVLQQPLGYKSGYQATMLANAFYQKFKPAEFNVVEVMYLHGAAPGFLMTKKPVTSIKDVKGLRLKANAENADIVTNLGGAPVTMPVSDTYDSLQRGVIDGCQFPIEALQGYKIGEIVKTVIEEYATSYMTSFYVIMNKEKWNMIAPADQAAIQKINQAYVEKQAKLWVELDAAAKTYAEGKGVKFITLTDAERASTLEAMKPIWDKYVAMTEGKGLPGREALKFCQDYLAKNP